MRRSAKEASPPKHTVHMCTAKATHVPVRIEKNEAVAANKVQATAARLGGEQEHEFVAAAVIELVHKFLK